MKPLGDKPRLQANQPCPDCGKLVRYPLSHVCDTRTRSALSAIEAFRRSLDEEHAWHPDGDVVRFESHEGCEAPHIHTTCKKCGERAWFTERQWELLSKGCTPAHQANYPICKDSGHAKAIIDETLSHVAPLTDEGRRTIYAALTQLAQCIGILAGQDNTRHEVMVEESRPILKAALRALRDAAPANEQRSNEGTPECPKGQESLVARPGANGDSGFMWVVWYEDAAVKPEVFFGEGAEEAARLRFKHASDNWSCHLLSRVPTHPLPEADLYAPASTQDIDGRIASSRMSDHRDMAEEAARASEPSTFHAVRELKARESGTQLASELAVLLRIADDQSLPASELDINAATDAALQRVAPSVAMDMPRPVAAPEWITCPDTGKQCSDYCDPGKGDRCAKTGLPFAPSATAGTWIPAGQPPVKDGTYFTIKAGDVPSEASTTILHNGEWIWGDGKVIRLTDPDMVVEWWMPIPNPPVDRGSDGA